MFVPYRSKPISFWTDSEIEVRPRRRGRAPLPPYFPSLSSLDRGLHDIIYIMPPNDFPDWPRSEHLLVASLTEEMAEIIANRLRDELKDETGREVEIAEVVQDIITSRYKRRISQSQPCAESGANNPEEHS